MRFIRPKPATVPRAQHPLRPMPAPDAPARDVPPAPNPAGSVAALCGLALTAATLSGKLPSDLARFAAIGAGASLAWSAWMDFRAGGLRNLIRADLMALLALYFLTLFEFLFPQPTFDQLIGPRATRTALYAVLLGIGALVAGRHLWKPRRQPLAHVLTREIPAGWLVMLFWGCFALGYLHMLLAVDFNVAEMVNYFLEPRFAQPWGRGRLGDWKALLVELGMLLYLLPPLAGVMLARRHRFSSASLALVVLGVAFTFFYAFTGGTRNVFAAYLVTFLISYTFARPPERSRELAVIAGVSAVLMFAATTVMLQFRTVGFRNWIEGNYVAPDSSERTLFVDYNLYAICRLTEVFPKQRDYLGFEIPYQALIRPIPRAIWKGKPEGLSTTIEEAMGVEGLTIATSYVGEAYMAAGFFGVLLVGLFFGAVTNWWNHLASSRNSELGILIYASGFFAAVISMRSLFVFTTALLPTLASIAAATYLVRGLAAQARRWQMARPPARRPLPIRRAPGPARVPPPR